MTDQTDPEVTAQRKAQRRLWLTRLAMAVAGIALLGGLYYLIFQRGRVHTDNAYVGAETAQVAALVAGAVQDIKVGNSQAVRKGDVLVVLDDADARVEVAGARAALLQAQQRFTQARANNLSLDAKVDARGAAISDAEAAVAVAQAEYDRVKAAADRREALAGTGAVSGEELTHARAGLAEGRATLQRARATLEAARATRTSARGDLAVNEALTRGMTMDSNPEVAAARARLDAAELALSRTVIRAPVAGIVTQKQVALGQRLAPGVLMMAIVPTDTAYVDANFKENQLARVRPGQPVELTSDFYGGSVMFHGRVKGLAGGTGAAFALIPAQNATGNWVKVVQRLPVRIALDPAELREHPLRVGLTMDAVIDTREP